jgi:hypothetical protein
VVAPAAVLRAGMERAWSWVQIIAVDDDGQVNFRQISVARARQLGDATHVA